MLIFFLSHFFGRAARLIELGLATSDLLVASSNLPLSVGVELDVDAGSEVEGVV